MVLDRLLAREIDARDERRVRTSLKLSNLPPGMTLGNFDFAFQPSIERRQIETLATCAFIRSMRRCWCRARRAWARRIWSWAWASGRSSRASAWPSTGWRICCTRCARTRTCRRSALRRKKYFNVSYLVVDEVGFEPMSQQDASLFFRLVSYRYRRGSTAITTNKSVKDWPGILAGDEAMTAAMLDRLLHKSVVLNVRGRSYRLQDLEKVLK